MELKVRVILDVVVLAGGLGTRLRSVVSEVPKCMAPVAQRPFLYYLLNYLSDFPVERVVLSVGYLREKIYEWIDECLHDFPFEILYAVSISSVSTSSVLSALSSDFAKSHTPHLS